MEELERTMCGLDVRKPSSVALPIPTAVYRRPWATFMVFAVTSSMWFRLSERQAADSTSSTIGQPKLASALAWLHTESQICISQNLAAMSAEVRAEMGCVCTP